MTTERPTTRPFEIRVPDEDVDDLQRRLDATRIGQPPAGEPWESGIDHTYLRELLDRWRDGFDWRRREAELNRFPQHLVEVAGQEVHLVQVLADRERYADPVPIVVTVMTDGLGHERYVTYGEDVGAPISDWIAALHPDAVLGLFATHAALPPAERANDLTEAERTFVAWLDGRWRTGDGYSRIQATRPDTLAVALGDSPVGLLAWVAEKLRSWSGADFAASWTADDVLTTVALSWFTRTIGTSFLPYHHDRHGPTIPHVAVPVGVAVQHGERGFPREYAERTYTDVRAWSELPRGGHFPAQQVPGLVAAEVRTFVAPLRDR